MLEEVEYCKAVIKKHFIKPLVMTEVDEQRFKNMDGCHICGEKYTDKDVHVRDHCHITGKFRGSAHQECNLKLRIKPENLKIPVIFRNLRGYDSHFIMQQIGEIANKHGYTNIKGEEQDLNINAIPNNMEKYMAFMLGNHLTFIDSFQCMSSSLDKLVSNLPKDDLIYTSKAFKGKRLDLNIQREIFNENLMAVHKIKETLTLNRPAYAGMCILDLSKTLMYDFHYNYIKKKYNDRAKLLFTDTDSLTYEIETVDAYEDFWTDKDMFDNSDYPENSPYYCNTNKKIIGKFKDDPCGIPITEFVGLKSKMYSYVKDNEKGGRTAKGIKKNVINNNIRHEDYKNTLINNE